MVFVCPDCRQAYTLGQCHIPSVAGTRATVTCACNTNLEITVADVPDTSWKRHFGESVTVLAVAVKKRC